MAILKDTLIQGACRVIGDAYMSLVIASGFKKDGSSDSYILLGGGGHKAVSDFATSGHNHDSVYAKLGAHNNLTASGNEFTFASSGFTGEIYLNYRTAGGTNGNITAYHLGNGKGGTLGTIIHSGNIGSQSVNYATSAGSANSVAWGNITGKPDTFAPSSHNHDGRYLKKVTVENNTTNDFNTFDSMTLTGRGDPTTGASLSNSPWTGAGPAGGYGTLTYLWSGYGTQMAWGYGSNRVYIRYKNYSNNTATWATSWDSLALSSDLSNYYNKTTSDGRYVYKSGDTITGALTVPSISVTGTATFSLAINGSILGNAATASRLLNTRTITIGSKSNTFDGSGDISFTLALIGAFASSSFTLANIKSTLGISNWALAGSKPSYAFSEITGTVSNSLLATAYLPLSGDTMTGKITFSLTSTTRDNGIIGTYDANRAAAIWSMGSSYLIKNDGTTLGSLYGACYVYYGSGYTYGAGKSGGHSFVWALNGEPVAALGNNIWTYGGFIKRNSSDSYVLLGGGGHKLVSDFVLLTGTLTISGNKTFSSSVSIDDLTAGNLVVTGGASFALTINGNISGNASGITGYTFKTADSVCASGWTNGSTDNKIIPTMSFIAYWNGAYSETSSNLAYCNKGAFGTACTHAHGDYLTSIGWDGTNNKFKWWKGGTELTAFAIPYATSAGSATSATKATSLKYIGSASSLDSDCTLNGIYSHNDTATGRPNNTGYYGNIFNISNKDTCSPGTNNHWIQLLDFTHDGSIWHRQRINTSSWTDWEKILTSANWTGIIDGRYLLLSGGTVTGAATFSQAINGNILGNAATASRLQNARTISLTGSASGSTTFDGSANVSLSARVSRLNNNSEMTYGWDGVNYFNIQAANLSAAAVNDTPFSSATWTHILRFNHVNTNGYYTDLAIPFNANGVYYKRIQNGYLQNSSINGGWVKLIDETDTSVLKADGTVTATGMINLLGSLYSEATTLADTTAALNLGNSNIKGLNAIYFNDTSNEISEGIHFIRSNSSYVDTLLSYEGNLYYRKYRKLGDTKLEAPSSNSHIVLHTGNSSVNTTDRTVSINGTSITVPPTSAFDSVNPLYIANDNNSTTNSTSCAQLNVSASVGGYLLTKSGYSSLYRQNTGYGITTIFARDIFFNISNNYLLLLIPYATIPLGVYNIFINKGVKFRFVFGDGKANPRSLTVHYLVPSTSNTITTVTFTLSSSTPIERINISSSNCSFNASPTTYPDNQYAYDAYSVSLDFSTSKCRMWRIFVLSHGDGFGTSSTPAEICIYPVYCY